MAIRGLVRRLAAAPRLFDALRWVLEGGYRGHHRVIDRFLANMGRTLDLGCGTGIYAPRFPAPTYVGADLSADYIAAARGKFPAHEFVVADATCTSFHDGEFDACMICGVLHHLDDEVAARVVKEAARVVRPGGRVVVWEDIPSPWWNVVGHLIHRLDMGNHIRKPAGYRSILERHLLIEESTAIRSGAMDYQVFVATPRSTG
jgi:ubiquinone/menaquinone biosynthesis C-methylase UbiE